MNLSSKTGKALIISILLEIAGLVILVFLLAQFLRMQHTGQQQLITANKLRYKSYLLADQLRQSSDDLTRMVRSYAASGDEKFEDYFWNILDIRDGKIPRPINYERVYWDFMAVSNPEPPFKNGRAISLRKLMSEAGFTESEFQVLSDAQLKSDELVSLERIAMHAMKGEFLDKAGNFSILGSPDPRKALDVLYGEEYHEAKKSIMAQINKFLESIDNRTSQNVFLAESQVKFYSSALTIVWAALILIGLILFLTTSTHQKSLSRKLKKLVENLSHELEELKQAENKISKLSAAVEQSPVSIVITDVTGNIEYVNSKFISLTEYTFEEAVGQNPRILKSDDQPEDYYENLWSTITSGKTWDGEFYNKKKNGEPYWESAKISPLTNDNGEITHFIAIKEDITERKALENQLRQSQKLETVGTMVGGISHELNNILQSMFLYGGLVQDQLPDNEELRANFQHILEHGERARDIVKQILTFSRKAKIDMKPQIIHEHIMESISLGKVSLPSSIDFVQDINSECGMVLCDKTQIHQIVMNLCNNAQHAMAEKGGVLSLSLHQVKASLSSGDPATDVLELTISDTGHGIDPPDLERIFDPFFTTKQLGQGTGLGLSVIHGIVEMMGGHISVTSEVAKGTTFKILFPVVDDIEDFHTTS